MNGSPRPKPDPRMSLHRLHGAPVFARRPGANHDQVPLAATDRTAPNPSKCDDGSRPTAKDTESGDRKHPWRDTCCRAIFGRGHRTGSAADRSVIRRRRRLSKSG